MFLPCIALLHAILGVRAAAKPPWMGLRRSSTGIPHTLKSAKMLKLGIAAFSPCIAYALQISADSSKLIS
ncbi:hypothetical protein EQU24_15745 [Methylotuvimicrobium buryatense]|uniref:Uncharacterized protein n=1 Tax=Methylotuvimicrobium buryatense TaxID=95641 RepID=A0A4P9UTG0_METBY|nr:hypothetical protein EQU24_15745 [Methylotuvimicrobium buryatense]